MARYRHNILKELWWNRPTKYIPEVVWYVKNYPYHRRSGGKFWIWLRNCLYLSWQNCLVEVKEDT